MFKDGKSQRRSKRSKRRCNKSKKNIIQRRSKKSNRQRRSKKKSIRQGRSKNDGSSKLGKGMAGSVYLVDIDNKKTAIKIINKNKSYRQEKFILQKITPLLFIAQSQL